MSLADYAKTVTFFYHCHPRLFCNELLTHLQDSPYYHESD